MVVPKRQSLFAEVTKRTLHTFKRLKLLCGSYEKANRISPNLKPESSYRQIYLETLLLCGDVRELLSSTDLRDSMLGALANGSELLLTKS